MSIHDKCTLIIQAFTKDKVEVQVRDGNNLTDVFCISNGEEKLTEVLETEVVTITRVGRRKPKDHAEVH